MRLRRHLGRTGKAPRLLAVLAITGGAIGAWQSIPAATATPVAAPYNFVLDGAQDSISSPPPANTVNWSQILTHNTTDPNNSSIHNQVGAVNAGSLPANYIADSAVPDYALPDATVFTSGSKDTLPISGWSCTTKNNLGAKDDLMNAYQTAYIEPAGGAAGASAGDLIVIFGADKSSDLGDNNFGFWLLQGQGKDSIGCTSGSNFTGFHTNGDLLLSAAFTNGGTTASIVVSKWTGCQGSSAIKTQCTGTEGSLLQLGTSGSECQSGAGAILPPAGAPVAACAITNTGNVSVPWYAPAKTTCTGNTLCPEEFYEGALDVSQLLGDQGDPAALPCFNNTITDTRSSQSPTATIFDYAFGQLSTCGPPNILTSPLTSSGSSSATSDDTSVAAIQVPIGSTLNDSATFTGTRGTVTGTVTFNLYKQLPGGTPPDCSGTAPNSQLVYTDANVPLVSGTATSADATGTLPGGYQANELATYSWQDVYTPDAASHYTARTETCGKETEQTVDGRIQLTPGSASNLVGNVHQLTATVATSPDGSTWTPVTGAPVTFGFAIGKQGSAKYYDSDGVSHAADTSSCVNGTGTRSPSGATNSSGTCNAYINDNTAELVQMNASSTFGQTGVIGTFTRSTNNTAPNSGPASKQYIDARISLSPATASNLIGNQHTLTAEVDTTTNGSAWTPLSGAVVNLSFTTQGSAFFTGAGATSATAATCTTNSSGQCNAFINDSTAETVSVHATVTLSSTNPAINPLGLPTGNTLTRSTGDTDANDSPDAQKTYIDARILLTPATATNIVGNVHTLTVEVDTNNGSGWTALSGALVNLSFPSGHQGNASFYSDVTGSTSIGSTAQCTTGATGKCPAFINDSTAQTVTVHATVTLSNSNPAGNLLGLNGTTNTLTRSTGDSVSSDSVDAQKTYVQPGTDLTVTDKLVGLPANATGVVSYTAYPTNSCTTGTGVAEGTDLSVTSGNATPSSPVTVGLGQAWTSVYWVVTYTGSDGQTFTSNCLESATGH